jgi:hypothetical protein
LEAKGNKEASELTEAVKLRIIELVETAVGHKEMRASCVLASIPPLLALAKGNQSKPINKKAFSVYTKTLATIKPAPALGPGLLMDAVYIFVLFFPLLLHRALMFAQDGDDEGGSDSKPQNPKP